MKQVWFRGTKSEDKDKRRIEVLNYRNAFDSLTEILNTHYKKKEGVRDYETPNWEFRQIAVNEYNRVLEDILELIDLNKKD
jgi:hypothetical protein|tara:strand:- start:1474 stop:1716 length:243 start_codon:yes stop_codon:yes gene_type:complete